MKPNMIMAVTGVLTLTMYAATHNISAYYVGNAWIIAAFFMRFLEEKAK